MMVTSFPEVASNKRSTDIRSKALNHVLNITRIRRSVHLSHSLFILSTYINLFFLSLTTISSLSIFVSLKLNLPSLSISFFLLSLSKSFCLLNFSFLLSFSIFPLKSFSHKLRSLKLTTSMYPSHTSIFYLSISFPSNLSLYHLYSIKIILFHSFSSCATPMRRKFTHLSLGIIHAL